MSIDTLLLQAATRAGEGRLDLAEPFLRQVLSVEPRHRMACLELARVLILGNRFDEAVGVLDPLANDPHDGAEVHRRLALAHAFADRTHVAVAHYRQALEFDPGNGTVLHSLANLEQSLGQLDEPRCPIAARSRRSPSGTISATVSPPPFRVMWMFAPGAGNTPPNYFIDQAGFESHMLTVLDDCEYDIDLLRRQADVVVNLVSDVDQGRAILGAVQTLAERIGKPVINHPRGIFGTDRTSVARRLAGTPGCVVPQTRTFSKLKLRQLLTEHTTPDLTFPLLVRPAGTHGGEDFEKADDREQLGTILQRLDGSQYYVTPFVDYRSEDGYFRKYRFIYVGGEILPYHLAIDDKWKVHHGTTPMADVPWMQAEEQAFLDDPWCLFGAPQRSALRAIRDVMGLDYFGIDCSLTRGGELVVFEVNATMLVHGRNARFRTRTKRSAGSGSSSMRCSGEPRSRSRALSTAAALAPALASPPTRDASTRAADWVSIVAGHDQPDEQLQALEAHIRECFEFTEPIAGAASSKAASSKKDAFWAVARTILEQSNRLLSDASRAVLRAESAAGTPPQFWSGSWSWARKMQSEIGPRMPSKLAALTPPARAHHELRLFNLALATVNHVLWDEASRAFTSPTQPYAAESDGAYPLRWADGSTALVEIGPNPTLDDALLTRIRPYLDPTLPAAGREQLYRHNLYCRRLHEGDLVQPEERALIGQWGVFAKRRIPEGTCIGVYGGTLLDHESTIMLADRRYLTSVSVAEGPDYYVTGENITSLMNTLFAFDDKGHIVAQSDQPYNVRAQACEVITTGGIPLSLIAFFSARNIEQDTELRWNYGYTEVALVRNGLRS
ncbi:MAG: tetratricopeptide repeat protein [Pararobbsia sp.]